ncbi:MAG: hypothetical protein WCJ55_05300 [Chloroflexales bacterium]
MCDDNENATETTAGAGPTGSSPTISVGAGISIGAGLGLVVGMLFGDMMLGMIAGAGIGTVIGAVYDMWRRPIAREKGKQAG